MKVKKEKAPKAQLDKARYRYQPFLDRPQTMTDEQKHVYKDIDEILWKDWDPIGINDIAPRDEYQSYTPEIFGLKIKGADKEAIAQKLNDIATNRMGLFANIDHCRQVAEKIINL